MSAFSSRSKSASSSRSAPDAVGRGVTGFDPDGPAVLFVLAGNSLGVTPVGVEGAPQWMDLRRLVSLDAVGDPVGSKLPIEASFDGGPRIEAIWPEPFCDQVIGRLKELLESGQMIPEGADGAGGTGGAPPVAEHRPASGPIEATGAESAPPAAVPQAAAQTSPGPFASGAVTPAPTQPAPAQPFQPTVAPAQPAPAQPAPAQPAPAQPAPAQPFQPAAAPAQPGVPAPAPPGAPGAAAQPAAAPAAFHPEVQAAPGAPVVSAAAAADAPLWASTDERPLPGDGPRLLGTDAAGPAGELTLEDVVYHGGYPGQTKKRKKCVAVLDATGVSVTGPHGPEFRLGWEVVRSVEAQNSDEAKFRLGVKVKRNSTVVVFDCEQGVTIVIEARGVSTMPLKGALHELLDSGPVSVA